MPSSGNMYMIDSHLQMYVETLFSSSLLTALDLGNSAQNSDQWLARSLLTPTLCRFNIGTCRKAVTSLLQTTTTE